MNVRSGKEVPPESQDEESPANTADMSENRPANRKSSRRLSRQSLSKGYHKLSHHQYQAGQSKSSFIQDLKRLILLLVIIAISGLLLWRLYGTLTEEYNYLGYVNSKAELGVFTEYAVSTDAQPCAKVGKDLLAKGGSAVDAAIGTLLCMGVVIPNSMGLGGGCLMTILDKKTNGVVIIDGREVAPDYATENMFINKSLDSSRGPLSIGVPGELAAYWEAHQRFGRLKWHELFETPIKMADDGHEVVHHLAYALRAKSHAQYITQPMAEVYLNPLTGAYYDKGEIMIQKALAETLKRVRDHGKDEFYSGLTGRLFIEDLQKQGGKMTLENLQSYRVLVKEPLKFQIADDLVLYTQPIPGSGVVLSIILRVMKALGYYKKLKPQQSFEEAGLYYHRLAETFKFAYAQRAGLEDEPDDPRMQKLMAKIQSEEFVREVASKIDNGTHPSEYYGGEGFFKSDHGTAHVSVVDAEGNAAAVTTSVNLYFGSGLISPRTGIVYNDVMDDFVSPNQKNRFELSPSKYNRIRPGKRPLSSMAPSVFTDQKGNVRLVVGGSGGSKITTGIASVCLRHIFLGESLKSAIDGPRIHHQYKPEKIFYERNFPQELLADLSLRGHGLTPITDRSSVIVGIASSKMSPQDKSGSLTANSDYRKGGAVDGG